MEIQVYLREPEHGQRDADKQSNTLIHWKV